MVVVFSYFKVFAHSLAGRAINKNEEQRTRRAIQPIPAPLSAESCVVSWLHLRFITGRRWYRCMHFDVRFKNLPNKKCNMNTTNEEKDAASSIILKAELAALLALVQELAETLNVETIDGLTPLDYFVRQRKVQLLAEVEELQERAPGIAHHVQIAADQTID